MKNIPGNQIKIIVLLFLVAFMSLSLVIGCGGGGDDGGGGDISPTPTQTSAAQWTVLVYIAADNSLEGYDLNDINEMEQVGSTDQVNIVVECDRSGTASSEEGWAGCRRYYITKDNDTSAIGSTLIEDLGTIDSGSYLQLENFIEWGVQNYPAQRYAVIVWNHGSGWQGRNKGITTRGIAWDDSTGNFITQAQLKIAFDAVYNSVGTKVELLGMDACVMGNIEVAYDFINTANYLTFSQASIPGTGWAYNLFLQNLVNNPTCDGSQLGTYIVNGYADEYGYNGSQTLSTINLSHLATLTSRIYTFVQNANAVMDTEGSTMKLICTNLDPADSTYTDYKDLDQLMVDMINQVSDESVVSAAQDVRTALAQAVVCEFHGNYATAYGLSIWVPGSYDYLQYNGEYGDLGFASPSQWGSFIQNIINAE